MSKRKPTLQSVPTYAELCDAFTAAEARGDVAAAARVYRQFAGSVHYTTHTARMWRMWGLA